MSREGDSVGRVVVSDYERPRKQRGRWAAGCSGGETRGDDTCASTDIVCSRSVSVWMDRAFPRRHRGQFPFSSISGFTILPPRRFALLRTWAPPYTALPAVGGVARRQRETQWRSRGRRAENLAAAVASFCPEPAAGPAPPAVVVLVRMVFVGGIGRTLPIVVKEQEVPQSLVLHSSFFVSRTAQGLNDCPRNGNHVHAGAWREPEMRWQPVQGSLPRRPTRRGWAFGELHPAHMLPAPKNKSQSQA